MVAKTLREFLKNFAKKSLYRGGYYRVRARLSGRREKRLLILMYHDLARSDRFPAGGWVDDDKPTPSQFEVHIRELTAHHRVVSMKDAAREIRDGGLLEDSVAVTFDDGNESVYAIAYPLLVKYGVPATLFVVPDWIENGRLSWWQLLYEIVERAALRKEAAAPVARILGPAAPVLPVTVGSNHIHARRRFVRGVEALFRSMPSDERMEKLARLRGALFPDGDFAPVASRILSWSQVEEMATHQIDIESHTQNHIHIATTDLATVDRELSESKKAIESHTGRSVSGFAYPFGKDLASYRTVEPLLRKHGFAYACNACHGNNSTSSNVFSLFRCTLPLTTSSALINYQFQVLFQQKSPDGHAPVAADRRSETATET